MKIVTNVNDRFISHRINSIVAYIGDIFESLEVKIGDEDYVMVDGKKAVVTINRKNQFMVDKNKEAIEILLLKNLLSIRFSGRLSEVLVDREIIRLGLTEKLFYYYYIILTSAKRPESVEDYVRINVPWLSLYPYDKENSRFLQELAEKCMPGNRKEYEATTSRLFALLKKRLYTESTIKEAEEEWTRIVVV